MSVDVTQRLLRLIADVLEIDPADVKPQAHFFNDLGASSLDIAEMVWRIEDDDTFGVGEIPDEVLENVRCVQDVIDFIGGHTHVQVPPPSSAQVKARAQVAVGADRRGFPLKEMLRRYLEEDLRISCHDVGPTQDQPVDYPEPALAVANLVASGDVERGVLISHTGIGMSITANKVPDVRAAVVQDPVSALLTRQHNDANVLCLGSGIIGEEIARACVMAFLDTEFNPGEDGRHQRRVKRISEIERSFHQG